MARPVIANIRSGDPDGNVWDLNDLAPDEFFAFNDNTTPDPDVSTFDGLIARLRLDGTGLTADDLDVYSYAFLGTNKSDTITGVTAEEGNNSGVIASGNGSDHVTGGAGDHVIFTGNGKDTARGGGGDDIVFGENGKDDLSGNGGEDDLRGGAGKDTLNGGLDDDVLNGGSAKDVLTGGEGVDELTGGKAKDQFQWNTMADFGDVVTDFSAGDKLVFDVEAADEGTEELEISIGNDDDVVDDGEVVINSDDTIATADIQAEIDANDNDTGTLFAFLDSDEGHAVIYYDANPSDPDDDDAVLVAHLENITTLDELAALSASDFVFI